MPNPFELPEPLRGHCPVIDPLSVLYGDNLVSIAVDDQQGNGGDFGKDTLWGIPIRHQHVGKRLEEKG